MTITRRQALTVLGVALLLPACGGGGDEDPASCGGTLTAQDQQTRTALGYTDHSPDPAKACHGCQQYVVRTAPGRCGTCKLLPGPVRAGGTCRAYAPQG